MIPYVADPDFTLYLGDVRQVLANLPAGSVDCCVTSPPYWGLRDYGHDGQIGLEQTPDAYVGEMVTVFREVRRVLAESGSLWLNLGDSYAGSWGAQGRGNTTGEATTTLGGTSMLSARQIKAHPKGQTHTGSLKNTPGLKQKDLVGIPWRVAFALQADGWWLRSDIVWAKPNPMPESVTDRPTKSHEYVFLLTKSPRYFYDADAIREPAEWARWGDQTNAKHEGSESAAGWIGSRPKADLRSGRVGRYQERAMYGVGDGTTPRRTLDAPALTRNGRSVWEIATQPYAEAHFATFPEELPRRCIAAGCPQGGTVLDPFMGSGTTALVARRLGRKAIGVELNKEYAALAARRLQQLSLLAEGAA